MSDDQKTPNDILLEMYSLSHGHSYYEIRFTVTIEASAFVAELDPFEAEMQYAIEAAEMWAAHDLLVNQGYLEQVSERYEPGGCTRGYKFTWAGFQLAREMMIAKGDES